MKTTIRGMSAAERAKALGGHRADLNELQRTGMGGVRELAPLLLDLVDNVIELIEAGER